MEGFNIASIGENIDDICSTNRVIQMIGNSPEVIDGVEYKNVNRVLFEGSEYFISHKAILTVNCTPDCNAACEFCCNGITFMP